jgi:ribosomal subunit interface protein
MSIKFTHRGVQITQGMKDYLSSKIEKFNKRINPTKPIEAVVKQEGHEINTEVMLETNKGKFLKVSKTGPDFYTLVDKIEATIRRELEKFKRS